jgi:RNA polymerase sigma-70 factor (ECF subfamily)
MATHRTLPSPPDELARLVTAAVAGDDDAFSALAGRHRTVLHAHCRRILGAVPDAEDAVQEALLRAWRRRGRFEGRSSFGWWLQRIATNACIDIARSRSRLPAIVRRPDSDDVDGDPPAKEADTDPAALVVAREAVEHAYLVAIRTLPARQRAVLVLRDVLRFSAADSAELLGVTVPSANSALQRARAALDRRQSLTPATAPAPPAAPAEHELVRRLVEAHHCADAAAVVATLERLNRRTAPSTPTIETLSGDPLESCGLVRTPRRRDMTDAATANPREESPCPTPSSVSTGATTP